MFTQLDVAGPLGVHQLPHLAGVARVDDQQPAVLGQAIEDHVVVRAATFVGEDVVACLTGLHVCDLVDRERLRPRPDVVAGDRELGHVREVEQPCSLAHRVVLLEHAGILHRHLEAAERHHASAKRQVGIVQRGRAQSAGSVGRHRFVRCYGARASSYVKTSPSLASSRRRYSGSANSRRCVSAS